MNINSEYQAHLQQASHHYVEFPGLPLRSADHSSLVERKKTNRSGTANQTKLTRQAALSILPISFPLLDLPAEQETPDLPGDKELSMVEYKVAYSPLPLCNQGQAVLSYRRCEVDKEHMAVKILSST